MRWTGKRNIVSDQPLFASLEWDSPMRGQRFGKGALTAGDACVAPGSMDFVLFVQVPERRQRIGNLASDNTSDRLSHTRVACSSSQKSLQSIEGTADLWP